MIYNHGGQPRCDDTSAAFNKRSCIYCLSLSHLQVVPGRVRLLFLLCANLMQVRPPFGKLSTLAEFRQFKQRATERLNVGMET